MDKQKFSPFYRTLSPVRAAGQKERRLEGREGERNSETEREERKRIYMVYVPLFR